LYQKAEGIARNGYKKRFFRRPADANEKSGILEEQRI